MSSAPFPELSPQRPMPSPTTSAAPSLKSSDKADALFQVRLLAALRAGDPAALQPFLAEVGKAKSVKGGSSGASSGDSVDLAALTLHLAIRCASYDTITMILANRAVSPNTPYPPESLVTPLHLAATLGRADIVSLLLEQQDIDDSAKDAEGRSVLDVAPKDVKDILRRFREESTQSYLSLLRAYIASPLASDPPQALLSLLSSSRVKSVDLSTLDESTGTTLLHEAARRNDLRLIELAVRAGADVFVRDRHGRSVGDSERLHGKEHERMKAFLRQFTNRETTLIDTNATEPPSLRGYLNKYTNVARGYNTRWFVLKDGMLSYYRHQDDENLAGRGSISMRHAKFKTSTSDRLRFEVSSTPTRHGSSPQKWYMRANHPVEVARWAQALSRNIEWYAAQSPTSPPQASISDISSITASPRPRRSGTFSGALPSFMSPGRSSTTGSESLSMKLSGSLHSSGASWKSPKKKTIRPFVTRIPGHGQSHSQTSLESKSTVGEESGMDGGEPFITDKEDAASIQSSSHSTRSISDKYPPHESDFNLQANSTQTQLELTSQLLASLVVTSPQANGVTTTPIPARSSEIKSALRDSLTLVESMFSRYTEMVKEREAWYQRKCAREQEKSKMWEDSLGFVVGESEGLERDLLRLREERRGIRRALRQSMIQPTEDNDATMRQTKKTENSQPPSAPEGPSATPTKERPTFLSKETITQGNSLAVMVSEPSPTTDADPGSSSFIVVPPSAAQAAILECAGAESDDDEDDADEFFDAIDGGNVSMTITAPLVAPNPTDSVMESMIGSHLYDGYAHPRSRLPISSDNRPPVSLWAVLKGSIGKDLTKISFPVFFNEPTSMLQRMAEDMEFAECLDAAAVEADPHKRIAFVAAFAMSNYSSTIGRIAKPFNPMLGETFEYCRLDRHYRYVSEQVSHHPPISACWAESPVWNYYGEVDAKNKFMGKSFEIRPTGVAHADLKLPFQLVANAGADCKYPPAQGPFGKGKVLEHYSWKKVTSNVSGFISGSPTIDHYGDMTVTNHRTGDKCTLSFKPRGWRSSSAGEIKGNVQDASGRVIWEIAGRWSSQLVARRVGSGKGDLLPDVSLSGNAASTLGQPEYLLLWRNTEKPHMPFNLTPFAITLNDCPPDTLKPYLPPTDCRLRPDQRAFENGKYDRANELKGEQEDFQRATRKRREMGELPPHRPRWFEATTEGDTGERLWAPIKLDDQVAYWKERENVWLSKGGQKWPNVEKIFIDAV
ncbi:hypothetical protein FRB93_012537 [Tulasnella sp. JGI-2019a]|nr:hypothetical protein FRB93_012537 [Tulasnella sp. JGI-2019a]